ncbi:GerAB/ArcD/ProY family transporter, partial [Priestia megaterium]|uniref:GerAB/ArcD/ProY family transporter n=1 Tax=Priestia megaterium TaxID=1404 RepID=UPI00370959AF
MTPTHLFILILLFHLPTTLLLPLPIHPKHHTSLAILLPIIFTFLLFLLYHTLYLYYPHLFFTQYLQNILPKPLPFPFPFLYILYFIYHPSTLLPHFPHILLTFPYPHTPLFIPNPLLILIIIYTLTNAIHVIAPSRQLLFIFMYVLPI